MLTLQNYAPPERFDPWKGPEYEGNGLWDRKVLVVGESHYDEWREIDKDGKEQRSTTKHKLLRSFTQECVQEVVNGMGGARYWTTVRNRLGGEEHEKQSPDCFWNKVAFYNFIQSPVSGCPELGSRPTQTQWKAASTPFLEALERLRPDRVLFTGKKLWSYVPPRHQKLHDVVAEGQKLPLEVFLLKDGKRVYATATAHPRSNLFVRELTAALHEFVVCDWAHETPGTAAV